MRRARHRPATAPQSACVFIPVSIPGADHRIDDAGARLPRARAQRRGRPGGADPACFCLLIVWLCALVTHTTTQCVGGGSAYRHTLTQLRTPHARHPSMPAATTSALSLVARAHTRVFLQTQFMRMYSFIHLAYLLVCLCVCVFVC
eukprot:COSAG01_NODE_5743_length_4062_cov_464.007318_5_plen_146_part_00